VEITQRRHRKLEKEKRITRASSPSCVLTSSKINVPSGVTQWNDLSGFEQQVTISKTDGKRNQLERSQQRTTGGESIFLDYLLSFLEDSN
jgi:hypothetical protein